MHRIGPLPIPSRHWSVGTVSPCFWRQPRWQAVRAFHPNRRPSRRRPALRGRPPRPAPPSRGHAAEPRERRHGADDSGPRNLPQRGRGGHDHRIRTEAEQPRRDRRVQQRRKPTDDHPARQPGPGQLHQSAGPDRVDVLDGTLSATFKIVTGYTGPPSKNGGSSISSWRATRIARSPRPCSIREEREELRVEPALQAPHGAQGPGRHLPQPRPPWTLQRSNGAGRATNYAIRPSRFCAIRVFR